MEPFTNNAIDPNKLPRLSDHEFVSLAPNFLASKFVADAVTAAVVVIGAVVARQVIDDSSVDRWIVIGSGVVLALLLLAAVLQSLSIRNLGYLVRDHDLSYRRGVVSRSTETIPFNRVQDVGLDRGPIERLFGLASLRIRSAGGVVGIEGLAADDATRLKDFVVARAGVEESGQTEVDEMEAI